jgi:RimJ/RimL family protein N-acetyltransferase
MSNTFYQGERVRLVRADAESMAELIARWNSDTEYYRLLDDEPATLATPRQMRASMDANSGPPDAQEFVIRTLAEDKAIGFIALWQGGPAVHSNAWLAIGIGERDYWGKGYGSDALNIAARFAFEALEQRRITLGVFEYNERAMKAYEKVGFKYEGRLREVFVRDGRRWDMHLMGLLREEWLQRDMRRA